MATKKYTQYRVNSDGSTLDVLYPKTSADQVLQSGTKVFLNPSTNKVNGKSFGSVNGTVYTPQEIKLYATDIYIKESSEETIEKRLIDIGDVITNNVTYTGTLVNDNIAFFSGANGVIKSTNIGYVTSVSSENVNVVSSGAVYTALQDYVKKETNKGLSTNDYTTAEKTKLSGVDTGAQVNKIETVKVEGTALTITNKSVNITAESLGLSGAFKYVGDYSTNLPTLTVNDTFKQGNVITYQGKEYVCMVTTDSSGNVTKKEWRELGDESSHALKSISITGTDGLGGGGTLASNRTITHNKVTRTDATEIASSPGYGGEFTVVTGVTSNDYGHITSVTTKKLAMPSAQTIPTVNNGTLTIQKNSTQVGTFSANQSTDETINITVPTKISEITNDKNYQQTFFINYATTLTKPTGAVVGDLVFVTENGTSW